MNYTAIELKNVIDQYGIYKALNNIDIESILDMELRIICRTLYNSQQILMQRIKEDIEEINLTKAIG